MSFFQRLACRFSGGHSWEGRWGLRWGANHPACAFCGKENPNGHRTNQAGDRSQAGAAPATGYSAAGTISTAIDAATIGARPRLESVATEIIAWRGWSLSQDGHGPVLYSLTRPCKWDGPSLTADEVPAREHDHGIYALAALDRPDIAKSAVVGSVALSGVVVEGESGYRAERATIRSLRLRFLPEHTQNLGPYYYVLGTGIKPAGGNPLVWRDRPWVVAEQLAQRYQCEVDLDWLSTSDLPAQELVI